MISRTMKVVLGAVVGFAALLFLLGTLLGTDEPAPAAAVAATTQAKPAPAAESAPAEPAAATPESCLSDAGFGTVEKRDVDLWRGMNADPF